jgi:hypothetical protein
VAGFVAQAPAASTTELMTANFLAEASMGCSSVRQCAKYLRNPTDARRVQLVCQRTQL